MVRYGAMGAGKAGLQMPTMHETMHDTTRVVETMIITQLRRA